MPEPMPDPQWRPAPAFAELAEVLGVPTTMIMAAKYDPADGTWTVLWTPDEEDTSLDAPVRAAAMQRSADGILQLTSLPRKVGRVRDFLP